ncbi:glycerol-3-phosphate dehydrogenase C-terminal domain-containing protein, partial [Streptomyces hirsutus]|uniref:glycerol-3-phosphate dehydrogenase C-terminal domain-containing protein n=1 Tax=Streptomyces hirsutus TaxID=35620 RepID=UPI0033C25CA8
RLLPGLGLVPRARVLALGLAGLRDRAPPHVLAALPAPRRLVRHYGTEAPAVHALGVRDARLGDPVLPGHPVTGAELLWAVRHEGALDESDLLDRRTRIGLVPADRAAALEAVRVLLNEALPQCS